MRALLLAAGLGTRLRPLTDTVPKCLVPVGGRPLLDLWLEQLDRAGIDDVLVNLHYLPGVVSDHLSTRPPRAGLRVHTVLEPKLLGTGGTLLRNRPFFAGDAVMMIHADNVSVFDMAAFMGAYERRDEGIEMTMMTFRTDAPQSCGIVEVDARGRVQAFHEKVAAPPGNLANAAVYIVSRRVVDFMAGLGKEVVDFSTEVIPAFLGRIGTFENDIYHRDIGTLESFEAAQHEYPLALAKFAADEATRRTTGGERA